LHDAGYAVVVTYSPGNTGANEWLTRMEAEDDSSARMRSTSPTTIRAKRCMAQIKAEVGPVDILINNAGNHARRQLQKTGQGQLGRGNPHHLDSVFQHDEAGVRQHGRARLGRIINVSSIIGSKGGFGQTN